MMKSLIYIGLLSSLIAVESCQGSKTIALPKFFEKLQQKEYDLVDTDSAGDLQITLEYLPHAVMALREAGDIETLKESYSSLVKNYEGSEFYELKIVNPVKSTRKSLETLFHSADSSQSAFELYADFGIQQDIKLVLGADTIPCTYLHREISETITNTFKYTIAFESLRFEESVDDKDRILIVNSKNFQLPNIRLVIEGTQIASLPTIKNSIL